MSVSAWAAFAAFWALFVAAPGPNAVNCIANGHALGLRRALPGVTAILVQASLFLSLSAAGVAALLVRAPGAFAALRVGGAAVLIGLGALAWARAGRPQAAPAGSGAVFARAFAIATVNAKSVAGYLAAFTQFVQPGVPIGRQMWAIAPTALTITGLAYLCWTALGVALGRRALSAAGSAALRRGLAACLILYGALLGAPELWGMLG